MKTARHPGKTGDLNCVSKRAGRESGSFSNVGKKALVSTLDCSSPWSRVAPNGLIGLGIGNICRAMYGKCRAIVNQGDVCLKGLH